MGKISIDQLDDFVASRENKNRAPKVNFFGLKNDKDSAIVRILHQSKADLDINVIHSVPVDGKDRRVSCLRNAYDPITNCPLCAAGHKVQIRVYIHLLVYKQDSNGNIVAEHQLFDRGKDYIEKIDTLAETYPPLYDTVFKVVRNGKAGDTNTTYEFMPLPATTYNSTNYPYKVEDLSYDPALGTIIWEKTAAQMDEYVATGTFPNPNAKSETNVNNSASNDSLPFDVDEPVAQPAQTSFNNFPVGPRRRV